MGVEAVMTRTQNSHPFFLKNHITDDAQTLSGYIIISSGATHTPSVCEGDVKIL